MDLDSIPPKAALRAKSSQYMARLEETRAEACEFLARSGYQYLGEVFRGGVVGVRSVAQVMQEREREVKGPAQWARESG